MASRSSTATTFIFLVVFLGIFALMANSIPSGFVPAQNIRETETRDDWIKGMEIGDLNFTDSGNLTKGVGGGPTVNLVIGDVHVDVEWWSGPPLLVGIWFWHTWQIDPWFFWEFQEFDDMPITLSDLEANSPHQGLANVSYMVLTCPCPKTFYTYFVYNSTTYSSWSDAWDGGELELYVGMGWNDAIEQQNAWSLIWSILAFQAPEVFGDSAGGLLMNSLIAVPLWAAFSITAAIILLWFIPLLGGE